MYQPSGRAAPVQEFMIALDLKLREKLLWQLFRLRTVHLAELKEPHFKHFSIERYKELYEVREKGKMLVRIIFTIRSTGEIILLHAFVKRKKRDTEQALEQSLRILAELRAYPERAVEFKF